MGERETVTKARSATLPRLTIPQLLALSAFAVFAALAFAPGDRLTQREYDEVRKLAVFLIGALLPSDALIRFGRSLFMRGQGDNVKASVASADPTSEMPRATVPQYGAFVAFLTVAAVALASKTLITSAEFSDINDVAVFLIAALLPSEAAIRFGRSLYLRGATAVTDDQLKRI